MLSLASFWTTSFVVSIFFLFLLLVVGCVSNDFDFVCLWLKRSVWGVFDLKYVPMLRLQEPHWFL